MKRALNLHYTPLLYHQLTHTIFSLSPHNRATTNSSTLSSSPWPPWTRRSTNTISWAARSTPQCSLIKFVFFFFSFCLILMGSKAHASMLVHQIQSSQVNNLREVLTWLRCEDTYDTGRGRSLRRRDIRSWSFAKIELSEFFDNLVQNDFVDNACFLSDTSGGMVNLLLVEWTP